MKKGLYTLFVTCCFLSFVASANAILLEGFEEPPNSYPGTVPVNASFLDGDGAMIADSATFAGAVSATEGTQFAMLTTHNPTDPAGRDVDSSGINEIDFAYMEYEFMGFAGSTLSFDYNALTGEVSGGVQDVFAIRLGSDFLVTGATGDRYDHPPSKPEGVSTFPFLTAFTGGPIQASYGALGDAGYFDDGQLGWSTYSTMLTSTQTYTLSFYVGDEYNEYVDTALLVDNIQLNAAPIPEPTTMLLFGAGLVGLVGSRLRKKK